MKNDSSTDQPEVIPEEINQKASIVINSGSELEPRPEANTDKAIGFIESENEREEEKIGFSFHFPTFEEFIRNQKEKDNLIDSELVSSSTSVSRYEFMSGKSYSGFIEEPAEEVLRFDIKQINEEDSSFTVSLEGDDNIVDNRISPVTIVINDEKSEVTNSIEEIGKPEQHKFLGDQEFTDDSDSESVSFDQTNSAMSPSIDSYSEGFLSDEDFEVEYSWGKMEEIVESEDFIDEEEDSYILEELRKIVEEDHMNDPEGFKSGFLSEQDFHEEQDLDKSKCDQFDDDRGLVDDDDDGLKNSSSETGDGNELETLWEHQELIEQLKMELKKVRATGLPTILEESESPKIIEDLKPWKIEEKFHHEECMDELHKFYRSYRERMRKFDIFNYQKMYAKGFLQLKEPHQTTSSQKSSGPALKSLLSQNFWQLKHRINCDSDPMVKFMKELESDLEVVYVGQMCLSWEFLHWQYGKALDLWDSDPRMIRHYNEVASEFQQFQVLLQRFIEDDPFQGPRVQHYTKSRCVNRYLLQVPVIREDKKESRRGRKVESGQYAITSDMLVEMMEESIRILWRFIRIDKDSSIVTGKTHRTNSLQLQNAGDLELLTEVKKVLHKKERKLKDALRSGNCILKRFGKCREDDGSDQVLCFFSQVDMKLVRRVLNMSKLTTEQIVWCHSKLSKISFEQRKIHVEPSFLLFPC